MKASTACFSASNLAVSATGISLGQVAARNYGPTKARLRQKVQDDVLDRLLALIERKKREIDQQFHSAAASSGGGQ